MDEVARYLEEVLKGMWTYRFDFGYSLFLGIAGKDYDHELLVVGQATNGWNNTFFPDELGAPPRRDEICRKAATSKGMDWVRDQWKSVVWVCTACNKEVDGKEGTCPDHNHGRMYVDKRYRTDESPFWQTIKELAFQWYRRADDHEFNWANRLAWTNLYKLSPSEGGNPYGKLQEIQREACVKILEEEICNFAPRHIVFMTNWTNWAEPFFDTWKSDGTVERLEQTDNSHSGWLKFRRFRVPFVVVPHPQFKKREPLLKSIFDAFQGLGVGPK